MSEATREVKFTREQVEYLSERLQLPERAQALVRSARAASDHVVRLTARQKDELVAHLSDRLQRAGFEADYRPTVEGRLVESIIDTLTAEPEPG